MWELELHVFLTGARDTLPKPEWSAADLCRGAAPLPGAALATDGAVVCGVRPTR